MDISLKSAPFKRDYLTSVSVILLVLVILIELTLMLWLPYQARSVYLWEKQVAQQEMLQTLDQLRDDLKNMTRKASRRQQNEIILVRNCLDDIARYVRANTTRLSIGQINSIYQVLLDFEQCREFFKQGGEYSSELEIDPKPALKKIFPQLEPLAPARKL